MRFFTSPLLLIAALVNAGPAIEARSTCLTDAQALKLVHIVVCYLKVFNREN